MKEKIGIIGANGSIGSELVKFYGLKNIKATSSKKKKNFYYLNLNKKINKKSFKNFIKDIKVLIYCASLVNEKNKKKLHQVNHLGFKKIINILKDTPVKIIYLSTMSIYPKNTDYLCHENMKIKKSKMAGGNYAYTKYLAEKVIKINIKKKSYLILRLTAIYGLNNNNNFLEKSIKKIYEKKKIFFSKPLNIKFNFLHIKQLMNCVDFLIKKEKYGIYNIGNYQSVTLNSIIKKMLNIYPRAQIFIKNEHNVKQISRQFIYTSMLKLKKTKFRFLQSKDFIC